MKKLITILAIVLTIQGSSQTWTQVKAYIDNQKVTENIQSGYIWKTIYRNTNMQRKGLNSYILSLQDSAYTDSILLTKSNVDYRGNLENYAIKEIVTRNDSMFIPDKSNNSFQQVLFYDGSWEYQQRLKVFVMTTKFEDKDKLLLKFVQEANRINLTNALYLQGLQYILEQ